jgi:hypothetical protein
LLHVDVSGGTTGVEEGGGEAQRVHVRSIYSGFFSISTSITWNDRLPTLAVC